MQKIKEFIESKKGQDVLIILIIVLVGIISFWLGRLSKEGEGTKGINIQYSDLSASPIFAEKDATEEISASLENKNEPLNINLKNYFASSRGSKYYPTSCSAGKNIKIENRIYFETREEAENAGYSLSSSCKG